MPQEEHIRIMWSIHIQQQNQRRLAEEATYLHKETSLTNRSQLAKWEDGSNPCHFRKAKNMYLHGITLSLNAAKGGKKVIGETQENKILNAGRGKRAKSLNPKLQVGVVGLQSDAKKRVLPSLMHCLGRECSLSTEQELCSSAVGEAYDRNKHFLAANTAPNSMIITFAGLSSIALKIKLDSRKLRPMKKSLFQTVLS